ncbi:MAG: hypothetical protein QOI01_5322 [Mycobacterium sp.]|jgi:hypothetical protein|nr:hypothetical protein [Mycobacterium sp.]
MNETSDLDAADRRTTRHVHRAMGVMGIGPGGLPRRTLLAQPLPRSLTSPATTERA